MKIFTAIIVTLIFVFFLAGCSKDDKNPVATPTTGTISGTISLPPGAGGDVANTRVAIYQSFDDWANDRVLKNGACNTNGSYSLADISPGSYYLDAWKDNNNNQQFDSGDFWGVYGSGTYPNYQPSPFSVAAGKTANITATIYPIP